jgi:arsenate reductase
MDRMLKVLFVCGGNSCRSQMAEGMLRAMAGDRAEIASAGLHAEGVNPLAIKVMHELETDISGHTSKTLGELGDATYDLVVTLCEPARDLCVTCIVATPAEVGGKPTVTDTPLHAGLPYYLHWLVPDPAKATGDPQQILAAFRAARDRIRTHIEALVAHGYLSTLCQDRQRQEQLLGMLEEGVMILDERQRIYVFNAAASRITGFQLDEVLGRHCSVVLGADGLERPIMTRQGGESSVRISFSSVEPAHEQPGRIIVVLREVRP